MCDKNIEIPIREVVLLEDRACVSRDAEFSLAAGVHTFFLKEVSPLISDKTLLAEASGEADLRIADCSVLRTVRSEEERSAGDPGEIEKQIESLNRKKRELLDRKACLETGIVSLVRMTDLLYRELPEDVAWGRPLTEEAGTTTIDLEDGLEESKLQLLDLEREMQELDIQIYDLGSVLQTLISPSTRYAADIRIRMELNAEASFKLNLEYQVPLVCWRPRYRAEITGDRLNLSMEGNVWQNTGEEWKDVQLYFSTQRLQAGTEPPLLSEDRISIQKKAKEELVEIREQEVQDTGGGSSPGSSSDKLPGIDDCGSVQNLKASGLSTIPSDGFPYRYEISCFDGEMERSLEAVPELSSYVYMISRQKNEMNMPLLAGPVDLIRSGGPAGRTSVPFIAPGENFELTWGPDPDLRISRIENETEEKTGPLSSWSSQRHRITVRLSNIGGEKKELTVTERIPVSELEKVRIDFDAEKTSPGYEDPDKNGMVMWKISLPPGGRKTLSLEYSIKRHRAVTEVG